MRLLAFIIGSKRITYSFWAHTPCCAKIIVISSPGRYYSSVKLASSGLIVMKKRKNWKQ